MNMNRYSKTNSSNNNNFSNLEEDQDDKFCFIDNDTAQALELVCNEVDVSNRRDTLLGFMNRTCTSSGYRILRQEILRPINHRKTLDLRLECVELLSNRADCHAIIINELNHFGRGFDLDKLVPNLVSLATQRSETLRMAEKRLDILVSLYSFIVRVPTLQSALQSVDNPILNIFKEALNDHDYTEIYNQLIGTLDFNSQDFQANKRNRMLHIKTGIHELFDIARATYIDAVDNLEAYCRELSNQDNLPWRITHAESKGFMLSLSLSKVDRNLVLPPKYIRIAKTRTLLTCSTSDMMKANVRANVSYENSMKLANEILVSLMNSVLGYVGAIHKLVEIVGRLDLLSSLSKLAIENNGELVRPKFSEFETIVEESRHPILDKILKLEERKFVPNDICLSIRGGNFCLITGPNMGGKSVYLKQVALIQIMAQLGSFVPAKKATIRLLSRIIVRVGTGDDGRSNCSSFMVEMKGIASALSVNHRESSLYIIDEVGRGTSVDDGVSYSLAIAEELALRENSFTIFSTHFTMLTKLPLLVSGTKVYQFKIEDNKHDGRKRNFRTHKLVPGFVEKCHYGIELAESYSLPPEITAEARRLLNLN